MGTIRSHFVVLFKSVLDAQKTCETGLLCKSSRLAPALGATKVTSVTRFDFGHTLLCYLSLT
jgi:hypothetical protein